MTLLCVPIFVESIEQANRDAALAAEAGADVIELRIDLLDTSFGIREVIGIMERSTRPCIVTCRAASEGGQSELPAADRVRFLAELEDAAYIDVEWSTLRAFPGLRIGADRVARLILSAHDFHGRPDRLTSLFAEMSAGDAEVVKVVWMARSIRDNLEAFELLQHRHKPTIALCMGEAGLISRVKADCSDR